MLLLAISCLIFTLSVVTPAFANGMQMVRIPASWFFGEGFYNRCYNNGEGEYLTDLTGITQYGIKETNTGYVLHVNGMGGTGTGEKSGDTYRFNGGLQEVVVNGNQVILIHNVRLVSNNHDNSFQLKTRLHGTIAPDGQLVVDNPAIDETICAWEE
jgi:hypothetical protein